MSPDLDVLPGKSVGIFQLGDTLWHVLDVIRTHKTQYPRIELSWDPDNPHLSAVTIHLPSLTLLFPHPSQTLQHIQIPSLHSSSLTLRYDTHVLSSASQPLTRGRVGRLFGPTLGGGVEKLEYPGIGFSISGSGGREELVDAINVLPRDGEVVGDRIKECVITPNRGITLHLPEPLEIILGETTSQSLLLDVGPPLRKFWKEDNRLERMWGDDKGKSKDQAGEDQGCFWNYFQHGLDFLIVDGIVRKILVHSNIPGTPLFQRYSRCHWKIPTSSSDLTYTSKLSSFQSNLPSSTSSTAIKSTPYEEIRLTVPTGNKRKNKRTGSPASSGNSSDEKVGSEPAKDGPLEGMVLDRVGEGGLDGVLGVGTSRLLGFNGIIVEEDQKSGGICSVLVFRDET